MKTHALRTSILALVVAAAGYAQSHQKLRADVPFAFVAGGATLSAGEYTVDQSIAGIIALKSTERKPGAFLLAGTGPCTGKPTPSRLVFHRYGNTYLLSQIWTEGERCGREVPVTARERELAARNRAPDETVILAVR